MNSMNTKLSKLLLVAWPAVQLALGIEPANAGRIAEEAGAIVCVNDKWDEKEPEKGHKLVDFAGRCVVVPDDAQAQKYIEDCVGKYEYMPDGSWRGSGTCTRNMKDGDKIYDSWEEGSHLKEFIYKTTGGTGKFKGASGSGTYTNESLSDALTGGRFKGKLELP